jgi:hypothetical protein
MPERTDPMTERLSRLTPSAAGLDRDALLFAAGQRSARSRLWPAIAGVLAIAQVATLVALWPRDSVGPLNVVAPAVYSQPFELPLASPPSDIWSAGSRPDVLQSTNPPSSSEFVSSGPPLTVGSSRLFD